MSNRDSMPKVSIIIPCWNAESYIADAIGSALGQSYPNKEVIVVNDGSTDGSQTVINNYKGSITSLTVRNGGSNKARNIGFKSSTGEFIKFLDADDYLWPGALARQVDHMTRLSNTEFSIGQSYKYTESTSSIRLYPVWQSRLESERELAQFIRFPAPITNPLYRRKTLKSIGCFDETIVTRQEVDLLFRYILTGNIPRLISYPIFVYRDHLSIGRVSATNLTYAYQSDIKFLSRSVDMLGLLDRKKVRSYVAEALALGIWNMGRDMLRNGFVQEAYACFEKARQCNPPNHIEGRFIYRMLTKIIGPLNCENILNSIKNTKKIWQFKH